MSAFLLSFCQFDVFFSCLFQLFDTEINLRYEISVFFVGDFFGEILLAILKNEKYGDFFGYFSRNLGEILGESSGHTG